MELGEGDFKEIDGGDLDLFDAVVSLEERVSSEGREAGLEKGRELGHLEGRELGLAKGGELGGEVGFYAGGVRMVRAYLDAPGNEHLQTPRLNKTLTTLMSLLDNYPVDNPMDERVLEDLLRIRAKFKLLVTVLKIGPLAYDPAAVEASKTMAF